ncbi:unnamed protein product [Amoebophrya sp. A25]|nr:unnamed protein product [Amoebophrya sp. A25]|eukprot:GSA25T00004831001.1
MTASLQQDTFSKNMNIKMKHEMSVFKKSSSRLRSFLQQHAGLVLLTAFTLATGMIVNNSSSSHQIQSSSSFSVVVGSFVLNNALIFGFATLVATLVSSVVEVCGVVVRMVLKRVVAAALPKDSKKLVRTSWYDTYTIVNSQEPTQHPRQYHQVRKNRIHLLLENTIALCFVSLAILDFVHLQYLGRKMHFPSFIKIFLGAEYARSGFYLHQWCEEIVTSAMAQVVCAVVLLVSLSMSLSSTTGSANRRTTQKGTPHELPTDDINLDHVVTESTTPTSASSPSQPTRTFTRTLSFIAKTLLLGASVAAAALVFLLLPFSGETSNAHQFGNMFPTSSAQLFRESLVIRILQALPLRTSQEKSLLSWSDDSIPAHMDVENTGKPLVRRQLLVASTTAQEKDGEDGTGESLLGGLFGRSLAGGSSQGGASSGAFAPVEIEEIDTRRELQEEEQEKQDEHYVFFIVESLRSDAFEEVFLKDEVTRMFDLSTSSTASSSSASSSASSASSSPSESSTIRPVFLTLDAYAAFPNTLKSALQFLCGRPAEAGFSFAEWREVVTSDKINTCLPHLLRSKKRFRTMLLSTGEHANHVLSEELLADLGFDHVVGRETLLAGTGNEKMLDNTFASPELARRVVQRYRDFVLASTTASSSSTSTSKAHLQGDKTFAFIFLLDSHAKWHHGKWDRYRQGIEYEKGIIRDIAKVAADFEQIQQRTTTMTSSKRTSSSSTSTNTRPRGTSTSKFFLIGDHGEMFGEHREWRHGPSLFNEALRVPIVVWGNGLRSGSGSWAPSRKQLHEQGSAIFSLADLHPTILEEAGLRIASQNIRSDLIQHATSLFQGGSCGGVEFLGHDDHQFSEVHQEDPRSTSSTSGLFFRSVFDDTTRAYISCDGRWKMLADAHHYPTRHYVAFDLHQDPTERSPHMDVALLSPYRPQIMASDLRFFQEMLRTVFTALFWEETDAEQATESATARTTTSPAASKNTYSIAIKRHLAEFETVFFSRDIRRMLLTQNGLVVTRVAVSGCSSWAANGEYSAVCGGGGSCSEAGGSPIYRKCTSVAPSSSDSLCSSTTSTRAVERVVTGGTSKWVISYEVVFNSGRSRSRLFASEVASTQLYPPDSGWSSGCALTLRYASVQAASPAPAPSPATTPSPTPTPTATPPPSPAATPSPTTTTTTTTIPAGVAMQTSTSVLFQLSASSNVQTIISDADFRTSLRNGIAAAAGVAVDNVKVLSVSVASGRLRGLTEVEMSGLKNYMDMDFSDLELMSMPEFPLALSSETVTASASRHLQAAVKIDVDFSVYVASGPSSSDAQTTQTALQTLTSSAVASQVSVPASVSSQLLSVDTDPNASSSNTIVMTPVASASDFPLSGNGPHHLFPTVVVDLAQSTSGAFNLNNQLASIFASLMTRRNMQGVLTVANKDNSASGSGSSGSSGTGSSSSSTTTTLSLDWSEISSVTFATVADQPTATSGFETRFVALVTTSVTYDSTANGPAMLRKAVELSELLLIPPFQALCDVFELPVVGVTSSSPGTASSTSTASGGMDNTVGTLRSGTTAGITVPDRSFGAVTEILATSSASSQTPVLQFETAFSAKVLDYTAFRQEVLRQFAASAQADSNTADFGGTYEKSEDTDMSGFPRWAIVVIAGIAVVALGVGLCYGPDIIRSMKKPGAASSSPKKPNNSKGQEFSSPSPGGEKMSSRMDDYNLATGEHAYSTSIDDEAVAMTLNSKANEGKKKKKSSSSSGSASVSSISASDMGHSSHSSASAAIEKAKKKKKTKSQSSTDSFM